MQSSMLHCITLDEPQGHSYFDRYMALMGLSMLCPCAADEAWYWLKCIQCSGDFVQHLGQPFVREMCFVGYSFMRWWSPPFSHPSGADEAPGTGQNMACAVGDFPQHIFTKGSGSLFVSGVMKGNLVPRLPMHKS